MTPVDAMMPVKAFPRVPWRKDLALALVTALVALAVNASSGFNTLLEAHADNDSLMRLVEVRDFLAGQSWFDLHQYRMGAEGGFVMHWSRLVDAPIAAIVLAVSAITGSRAIAETVVQILWPALLYTLTVFFLARAARRFSGEDAVSPAVIIGATALYFLGIFSPGALDHHNVQLMLACGSAALLLDAPRQRLAALLSGTGAALMLAVGMETAPHVAALGLCVSALFAFGAAEDRRVARDFGLGLAATSAVVFVATIPVSDWGKTQCDAFSTVQFALAALAGTGLAAIACIDGAYRTRARRLLWLALLGAAIAAVTLFKFPECLAAPYSTLDPRLHELWLDHISEAQSMFQLMVADPGVVAARYATPILAIILMIARMARGGWRREDSIIGVLLAVSFAVSVWQVRGSTFSIAMAVIPLSAWIAGWRKSAQANPSPAASLRLIAIWLISLNASWVVGATAASAVFDKDEKVAIESGSAGGPCETARDFAVLAGQPATTVLAISNLGASILAYSDHRAFAGPYHRNVEGDLLALDALTGPVDAAKSIVERHHVGLVAFCRNNGESRFLFEKAPGGLLAELMRGDVPAWLDLVADTRGKALELYRVRPPAN